MSRAELDTWGAKVLNATPAPPPEEEAAPPPPAATPAAKLAQSIKSYRSDFAGYAEKLAAAGDDAKARATTVGHLEGTLYALRLEITKLPADAGETAALLLSAELGKGEALLAKYKPAPAAPPPEPAAEEPPPPAPPPGPRKLRTQEKGSEHRDEEKRAGSRMLGVVDPADRRLATNYAKDPKKSEHKIKDGRLVDAAGQPVSGDHEFVVNPETGNMHTFEQNAVCIENTTTGEQRPYKGKWPPDLNALAADERFLVNHHTTPLAGKPVAGAGLVGAEEGKIKKVRDKSGHYKPPAELTLQTVQLLKDQGAQLIDDAIEVTSVVAELQRVAPLMAEFEQFAKEYNEVWARYQQAEMDNPLRGPPQELEDEFQPLRARLPAMLAQKQEIQRVQKWAREANVEYKAKYAAVKQHEQDLADVEAKWKALRDAGKPADKQLELQAAELEAQKAGMALARSEVEKEGVGPSNREAQVELGGKGITAEEFALVKGDRAKINKVIKDKFGINDALPPNILPAYLSNITNLNIFLFTRMKAVTLGAEEFLQTAGNEKAIRQKEDVTASMRQMPTLEEFETMKGDRAALNEFIKELTGRADVLPADIPADVPSNYAKLTTFLANPNKKRRPAAKPAATPAPAPPTAAAPPPPAAAAAPAPAAGEYESDELENWLSNTIDADFDCSDELAGKLGVSLEKLTEVMNALQASGDLKRRDLAGELKMSPFKFYEKWNSRKPPRDD